METLSRENHKMYLYNVCRHQPIVTKFVRTSLLETPIHLAEKTQQYVGTNLLENQVQEC